MEWKNNRIFSEEWETVLEEVKKISSIKRQSKNTLTIMLIGEKGTGKSLFMCIVALIFEASKLEYMTNFNMFGKLKHRDRFTIKNFYKNPSVKGVFIDEIHNISDQFSNNSLSTKLLVALFTQSRKRGQTILLATQYEHKVAKDLRALTDIILYPFYDEDEDLLTLNFWDIKRTGRTTTRRIKGVSRFFNFYNTDEIIYSKEIIDGVTNYMLNQVKLKENADKKLDIEDKELIESLESV